MSKYGKLIRVQSCSECPKLMIKWNDISKGYTDYCCRLQHKKEESEQDKIIKNIKKIPRWCPLEDYP